MNELAGRSGQNGKSAKFVTGSTMRHVAVMTSTGSIGLMAIFVADFLNLFYISLLGEQELAAAIGHAGSVLAFNIAIGIGMTIAATALISRALGAENRDDTRHMFASALSFIMVVSLLVVICLWPFIPLALGGIVSGIGAATMAFRVTESLDTTAARDAGLAIARPVVSPFSSGQSHIN